MHLEVALISPAVNEYTPVVEIFRQGYLAIIICYKLL